MLGNHAAAVSGEIPERARRQVSPRPSPATCYSPRARPAAPGTCSIRATLLLAARDKCVVDPDGVRVAARKEVCSCD